MKTIILTCIGIALCLNSTSAQNWTGNVNSDWNNSANWTGWPLNGDDIVIDPANYTGSSASPVITANSVFSPAGMLVQNGANLTISANLNANDRIEILGAGTIVTITNGTFFASGGGSDGRLIVGDDAHMIVSGGTAQANQRIIAELGGHVSINGGTLHSFGEVAIGDGSALASSNVTLNSGSVIVDAILGFENEAGNFQPSFIMNGGTLLVDGDISWLGVAPGSGTPRFIQTAGMSTVNGNIVNEPASTVNLYLKLSATAQFNFNGPAIIQLLPNDSIIQTGNSVFRFSNTCTWDNNGVVHSDTALTVFNGTTILSGTGSYAFGDVEITPAHLLRQLTPPQIQVRGDFRNDGAFQPLAHSVIFSGTIPQQILGATQTDFYSVEVNNSSTTGINLNRSITISSHLQLNDGVVNVAPSQMLTILDNATTSNGNSGSYVSGPLKKTGDDAFTFPIGKNANWRRLAISAPSAVTSEWIAEYFDHPYASLTPVNTPLSAVSNIEYWSLSSPVNPQALNVRLYWEDAMASGIFDCSQLAIGSFATGSWNAIPGTTSGTCTGSGGGNIVSGSTINAPAILTFGYMGNVTTQTFSICAGDSIVVDTNVYNATGIYFDILTAADLSDSIVITNLTVLPLIQFSQNSTLCAGDSLTVGSSVYLIAGNYTDTLVSALGCDSIVQTVLNYYPSIDTSVNVTGTVLTANQSGAVYQWLDCNPSFHPIPGETDATFTAQVNSSYAVAITLNGCTDTSSCKLIQTVGVYEQENVSVNVFPNPSDGVFSISANIPGMKFSISDMAGRTVYRSEFTSPVMLVNLSGYNAGIYLMEIETNGIPVRKKLVIR